MQTRASVSTCLSVVMGGATVGMVQTNNAVSTLVDQLPLTISRLYISVYCQNFPYAPYKADHHDYKVD